MCTCRKCITICCWYHFFFNFAEENHDPDLRVHPHCHPLLHNCWIPGLLDSPLVSTCTFNMTNTYVRTPLHLDRYQRKISSIIWLTLHIHLVLVWIFWIVSWVRISNVMSLWFCQVWNAWLPLVFLLPLYLPCITPPSQHASATRPGPGLDPPTSDGRADSGPPGPALLSSAVMCTDLLANVPLPSLLLQE